MVTTSDDDGRTWSPAVRLPDGVITLRDGRHLLVYNHTVKGRGMVNANASGMLSSIPQCW